jgi:TatD DNase family protein
VRVLSAPLIDADCNLWHRDLRALLPPAQTAAAAGGGGGFEAIVAPDGILQLDAVRESNIVALLSPSSTLDESRAGAKWLEEEWDRRQQGADDSRVRIRTTVGVHPYHVSDEEFGGKTLERHMEVAERLIRQSSVIAAVGECGLDASEGFPPVEDQIPWFREQIALAERIGSLPLFVHERKAFQETMELLRDSTVSKIIIHCFTGSLDECRAYVDKGYYISLSGYVFRQDEEAESVRQCLEQGIIPLDKLMIETDAPYMGFSGCREAFLEKNNDVLQKLNSKKRKRLVSSTYPNVPSSLTAVLLKVLHHTNEGRRKRDESPLTADEFALQMSRNANDFFQFGLDL